MSYILIKELHHICTCMVIYIIKITFFVVELSIQITDGTTPFIIAHHAVLKAPTSHDLLPVASY